MERGGKHIPGYTLLFDRLKNSLAGLLDEIQEQDEIKEEIKTN